MKCIICDNENNSKSIEHIVSESFGNKDYVISIGEVCDTCNARFSGFENTALSNSVFIFERARFGIETKKGHTAKGKLNGISVEGDKDFRPGFASVRGLNKENFKDFDPLTQEGHLVVPAFDKSEVATSKLLLKTGIEALYKSQRKVFNSCNFQELKDYLQTNNNIDWPFVTSNYEIDKFESIPRFTDKFKLNKINCYLSYLLVDQNTLLFKFRYGAISMIINLINRDLGWIQTVLNSDNNARVYPVHYLRKIEKVKLKKV